MREPRHWQAIRGDFKFDPSAVVFRGSVIGSGAPGGEAQLADGLAMSDVRFGGGSIEAEVQWESVDSFPHVQIVLQRNALDDSMITAGISGSAPSADVRSSFAIRTFNGVDAARGWQTLARTANVVRPASGAVSLRVTQAGSIVDLYADDVHVLRHLLPTTKPGSQCGLYCRASGQVTIKNYRVATHRRSAFVVMQFGVPYDQLYTDVIRPVVVDCGFDVIRADDDFGPGLIIADVVRRIQQSEVIIADITPENQNVFYEVGYAHALGKPTILLAEKGKRLPFDVSGFRTLFYENSIAGKAAVEQGLRRHVEAITREQPAAMAG